MKALGLDEASKRLPREEAMQRAAALAAQPGLELPLALPGDVALQRRALGRPAACGCCYFNIRDLGSGVRDRGMPWQHRDRAGE